MQRTVQDQQDNIQQTLENLPEKKEPHGNLRIAVLRIAFTIITLAVLARLIYVQILNAPFYQNTARKQYQSTVPLHAERGLIFDRNGSILVSNWVGYSYAADPELMNPESKQRTARRFASIFNLPVEYFLGKLESKSRFVWLARNITPEQAAALNNFKVFGVIRIPEQRRLYPYGEAAGQVLGFTNVDGKGLSGIELEFDSVLAGKDGYEVMQLDGIGRKMPSVDYPKVDPIPGENIELTIDLNLQQIVEEELAAGVERAKAAGGSAVFIDPQTGEILAMANYPGFDPSKYATYSGDEMRNRAITDVFEPGSTFKIVTAGAALEEGIERPDSRIYAENGKYTIYGRLIEDYEHAGWITFRQAVEISSNIAFSKIGMKVGADRFFRYARDFGFGVKTGIELPGEVSGELKKPYEWSRVSLPFMSFGYEVMATTLQMADAYAAVANGGRLMQPYIVKKIFNRDGKTIFENSPMEIRRVITPSVAQTLQGLLTDVVEHGTGKPAKVDGLLIAGKTGTAQKLVEEKYSKRFYHASFAGFFPIPNPLIAGYIMIDSPQNGYTGGQVAAPVFGRIASRVFGILRHKIYDSQNNVRMVSNEGTSESADVQKSTEAGTVRVPDVRWLDVESAKDILLSFNLQVAGRGGKGTIVISQEPAPGSPVQKGSKVVFFSEDPSRITTMPDFRGEAARKASTFLLSAGIPFKVVGSGQVVSQMPAPGSPINHGTSATIYCQDVTDFEARMN
ncbi:MAG: penicillin-binding transpeptidase domain-containing protein [Candidatus Kryptoniota bacterium]